MDIKEKIEEIAEKVKSDKDFASKFSSKPAKAIESILGVDLPDDQVNALINGIKAKLSIDNSDNLLGSLKKMF